MNRISKLLVSLSLIGSFAASSVSANEEIENIEEKVEATQVQSQEINTEASKKREGWLEQFQVWLETKKQEREAKIAEAKARREAKLAVADERIEDRLANLEERMKAKGATEEEILAKRKELEEKIAARREAANTKFDERVANAKDRLNTRAEKIKAKIEAKKAQKETISADLED